jgi:hypothetical protein
LEKDRNLRYHHASEIRTDLQRLKRDSDASHAASAILQGESQSAAKSTRFRWMVGALTLLLWAIVAYFWIRHASVPTLSNYLQLTYDGQPKSLVGTDGSRLYLYLRTGDYRGMAEMSISGGESRRVSILPSSRFFPVSLSQDGSQLVAEDGQGSPPKGPLWSMPVLGGSPRRLGDTAGQDAAWSPDGTMLAYSNGSALFLAKADVIILKVNTGVIFTGGTEIAERGGINEDDFHTALLFSQPGISQQTVRVPVLNQQVAPTIIKALGFDPK